MNRGFSSRTNGRDYVLLIELGNGSHNNEQIEFPINEGKQEEVEVEGSDFTLSSLELFPDDILVKHIGHLLGLADLARMSRVSTRFLNFLFNVLDFEYRLSDVRPAFVRQRHTVLRDLANVDALKILVPALVPVIAAKHTLVRARHGFEVNLDAPKDLKGRFRREESRFARRINRPFANCSSLCLLPVPVLTDLPLGYAGFKVASSIAAESNVSAKLLFSFLMLVLVVLFISINIVFGALVVKGLREERREKHDLPKLVAHNKNIVAALKSISTDDVLGKSKSSNDGVKPSSAKDWARLFAVSVKDLDRREDDPSAELDFG